MSNLLVQQTVRKRRLTIVGVDKLFNTIPCGKIVGLIDGEIVGLIENMLSDRRFRVFAGEISSKSRTFNNGLPQGSVIVTNSV